MFRINLTKEVLKTYLDILPISYYLGRIADVHVTEGPTSYCILGSDKIFISLPQLNTLKYEKEPNEEILEKDIRCMIYHEVSHALLTPKDKPFIDRTVLNIFEDERIETLLDTFYMDVDFKSFVKRINNFDPKYVPKNAMQYFYSVVRFRHGESSLVKRVEDIIYDARYITQDEYEGPNLYSFDDYQTDVKALYGECKKYFDEHYEETLPFEGEPSEQPTIFIQVGTPNSEKLTESIKKDALSNGKGKHKITALHDGLKNIVGRIFFINEEIGAVGTTSTGFNEKLKKIIEKVKDKKPRYKGKQLTTYSGRLNPRLTINNDYKWFTRQNMGEQAGHSTKLQLNLFIDTSGSFYCNVSKTNAILKELDKLEKSLSNKFNYKLITMDSDIKIVDGERRINANGGTRLDPSWANTFNKVQTNKCKCVNIILFDGCVYDASDMDVFSIFNKNNVIIISDKDNEEAINKYCPSIKKKVIVCDDRYTQMLEDNIINALDTLIR